MTTNDRMNLDEVAASVVRAFPPLDVFERRLSLELYRLLAGRASFLITRKGSSAIGDVRFPQPMPVRTD